MSVKVSELLAAFPEEAADHDAEIQRKIEELVAELEHLAPPTGALSRGWALTGLQAHVGLAYFAYWIRGWFQNAEEKKRQLSETHLKTAVKLLGKMGYLRGAVMKAGQTIANYPEVVPAEFIETLNRLHFDAPPMHYSLLREFIRNELGKDPEEVFDSFETKAFAAASLGQVHRARLKSGEKVAVKIQYPGIGKTIRSDFRNLSAVLFPLRLTKDWTSLKEHLDEIVRMLELETDYEKEAATLRTVRGLFTEDDGILVPRVHEQFSTSRVLTMDFIDGVHAPEFLRRDPPQDLRNAVSAKIYRALMRMDISGNMFYADVHPGNFLLLDDGRVGLIDFGWARFRSADEIEFYNRVHGTLHGTPQQRRQNMLEAINRTEENPPSPEFYNLIERIWNWEVDPIMTDGPFEFDEKHFRLGIDLMVEALKGRHTGGRPLWMSLYRSILGTRALLYQLRARVNVKEIYEGELARAGIRTKA